MVVITAAIEVFSWSL